MPDHPLICSGKSVCAIREDRKTETLRVIKSQPKAIGGAWSMDLEPGDNFVDISGRLRKALVSRGRNMRDAGILTWRYVPCPYGKPGDLLWVKETCQIYGHCQQNGKTPTGRPAWRFSTHSSHKVLYAGEFITPPKNRTTFAYRTRPSIYMPKWACRLWLEVLEVGVERVQDITLDGARAEGVQIPCTPDGKALLEVGSRDDPEALMRAHYASLWDRLNAKRGYGWFANPWVWRVTFKVAECNIS